MAGEFEEVPVSEVVFQLVSDIHLEFHGAEADVEASGDMERRAPVLILAGDISTLRGDPRAALRRFLRRMALRFELVVLVPGNHEYYGMEYHAANAALAAACAAAGANCRLLIRGALRLNGAVRVVGCTLWSHVPREHAAAVGSGLNDYRLISLANGTRGAQRLRPADTNVWHAAEREWLEAHIVAARAASEPLVVVTHHAPLLRGTSEPQYDNSPLIHAFATDLPGMLAPPVVVWMFGHTHYSSDRTLPGGTRVVSNQRGYFPGNRGGLRPGLRIEIPSY